MNDVVFLLVHISLLLNVGMIILIVRKSPVSQIRTACLVLIGIMTIWSIGTVLETDFRMVTGELNEIFVYICYIGICLSPIAILYLGKIQLQPDLQLKPKHALFMVIPVVSIVMVFTNPLHNLFFVNLSLYSSEAVYGAYYYFHSLYSYGCIAVGIILMITSSMRNSGLFSMQSMLVIIGIVVTLVPNMLYSFGIGNMSFSISMVAFSLSIPCFAIAFLKYRFIVSMPITIRQVVDHISDGYLVIDKNSKIMTSNQTLHQLFPDSGAIALGTDLRIFAERYFLDISYEQLLELQTTAVEQQKATITEGYAEGDMYVSVEVIPIINRNLHSGSIILIKDITQSKLLIEATQSASRAKSEFLSHMSHEIRTPLNAIIGMINIGRNAEDVDRKNYCFERADSASKHLLTLINNVLDMSKIEADKFELSYSKFDFEKMLMQVTNLTNVRVEEKQLEFIVNFRNGVPAYIESDELRLSQVITNLLTNAIKFIPEKGRVTLSIDNIEETDDEITLRIEVADTGIGISKEQQERLFTSYTQANVNITKEYGGTGLGLVISKQIIELMGGNIWVESELGEGSKFIFTIKTKKFEDRPRAKLSASLKPEDIRILVVDDSVEIREYFAHIMEALHFPCDVAAGGKQAIDMIQNAKNKPYNIFFIDWQMPHMNGIELAKKIKTIEPDNSIVIMISLSEWNTIEKEATAAGVDQFISKLLFPSTLINAINLCIGVEAYESSESVLNSKKHHQCDFSSYALLIAEDIDINREIMSAVLDETKVSIDYAENGKVAVSLFSQQPEKYDLILMDVNMPEMDGHEATKTIRALDIKRAKDIPIIAMTANVFKKDIEKCIESGMNDHTGKPVDPDALFVLLNKYLVDNK